MSRLEQLARVYAQVGVPLDRLPYSDEMNRIAKAVSESNGKPATCREIWWDLLDLRKGGKLPKVGRHQRPA